MGRDMGPILAERDKRESQMKKLREFVELQGTSGNWNYDPYMQGMFNGMEFMLSIVEDREPVFKSAPEQWLCDKDTSGIGPEAIETTEHHSEAEAV